MRQITRILEPALKGYRATRLCFLGVALGLIALLSLSCAQNAPGTANTLQIFLEKQAQPGATVNVVVISRGKWVEGAKVVFNGSEIGTTNAMGRVELSIPSGTTEVKIEATTGDKSATLELEFQQSAADTILEGTVVQINGNIWKVIIGGDTKTIDVSKAEISGNPVVGSKVGIEGIFSGDLVASKVQLEEAN